MHCTPIDMLPKLSFHNLCSGLHISCYIIVGNGPVGAAILAYVLTVICERHDLINWSQFQTISMGFPISFPTLFSLSNSKYSVCISIVIHNCSVYKYTKNIKKLIEKYLLSQSVLTDCMGTVTIAFTSQSGNLHIMAGIFSWLNLGIFCQKQAKAVHATIWLGILT